MTEPVYCTTCGKRVVGSHPASCNGPLQRFVTRAELEATRGRQVLAATAPSSEPEARPTSEERRRRHRKQAERETSAILLYRRENDADEVANVDGQ